MKKILFLTLSIMFVFWTFVLLGGSGNYGNFIGGSIDRAKAATTGNVLLTGTVLQYITLANSAGSTVSFGNITPGTPKCGDVNTQIDVTTNASGGYTLAISDTSATNSPMVHADGTTYIPDMGTGTLATPVVWVTGTHLGVGINLYSGTQKEAGWGTGTTACDVLYDKWGAVPATATTGHTVTGYHASLDSSSWTWRIDVANTQKTGIYSGNVLFTTAAVLT